MFDSLIAFIVKVKSNCGTRPSVQITGTQCENYTVFPSTSLQIFREINSIEVFICKIKISNLDLLKCNFCKFCGNLWRLLLNTSLRGGFKLFRNHWDMQDVGWRTSFIFRQSLANWNLNCEVMYGLIWKISKLKWIFMSLHHFVFSD